MMIIEWWGVNYRIAGDDKLHVKVFESLREAQKFAQHPPADIEKIVGKPWDLMQ